MKTINEARIVCEGCNIQAEKSIIYKNGYKLRAWNCPNCDENWVHPTDLEEYNKFKAMSNKTYSVKLRLVGNSYAVSIPREIIDFQENLLSEIDEMIKMSLESPEKLSLFFTKKEDLLNQKRRIPKQWQTKQYH